MLSNTAKYALRALVHLANLPSGQFIAGRDLARATGIPQNYLAKILWTLGTGGIIDATRGTGGGYRLRRAPVEIRVRAVVDLFDRARLATECLLDDDHPCSDETACAVHASWRDAKLAYVAFLDETTLETLAKRQAALDIQRRDDASG